jgi:hypothetical protein
LYIEKPIYVEEQVRLPLYRLSILSTAWTLSPGNCLFLSYYEGNASHWPSIECV